MRFAVVSRSQEPEIRRILLDKEPATFEVVVESAGLEEDELERLLAEEEGNQPPDAVEAKTVSQGKDSDHARRHSRFEGGSGAAYLRA